MTPTLIASESRTEAFVMVKSGVNPTTFKNCVCGDEDLINEEDVTEVAESINALVNFPKGNAKRYRQRYIRDLNEPIDAVNTAGGRRCVAACI